MAWIIVLLFFLHSTRAANILVLSTTVSHSHTIYSNAITMALAAKGHKLVFLSPDEDRHPHPNVTTFHLEGGYEDIVFAAPLEDFPDSVSVLDTAFELLGCEELNCKLLLTSGNKKFYKEYKDHKFDLILIDVSGGHCFMKYIHVFGHPPVVGFTPFFSFLSHDKGNFENPAYVPHYISGYDDRMTFSERFNNWMHHNAHYLAHQYLGLPKYNKISEEFFGFAEPKIQDLQREVSLILTDEHFSISRAKPTVPAVIPVAGLHIKPAKPLPESVTGNLLPESISGMVCFAIYRFICHSNLWKRIDWQCVRNEHLLIDPLPCIASNGEISIIDNSLLTTRINIQTPGGLLLGDPTLTIKDIQEFVNGAKHGVIYFSLGSNFLSMRMTSEKKQMFLEAFRQLPQRILWKYEDDTLKNIPENVLVRKWFPQTDILGNNKTILFMTHNGNLGTHESIYFGVPMLGFPICIDQFANNAKIVRSGLGLKLQLKEIKSSEQIIHKITTITSNPSFKEKAERLSLLYRDRPMAPLDTAVYWIEYVLRHKGAGHLQVASLDLAWYQLYLVDIYLTIAVSIFVVYYTLSKLIRILLTTSPKQKKS